MIMDIDVWCQIPDTLYLPLTCDNFHLYDFDGVSQLSGCEGNLNATGLARESCSWECKNGRPVIRCIWMFGFDDYYDLGERLQKCWLSHMCSNESVAEDEVPRTNFHVVCEPTEPVVATFVTRVATVRRDVLAARGSAREAEVHYSASLSSHQEAQAALLEAETSRAQAGEVLTSATVVYDDAVAEAPLDADRDAGPTIQASQDLASATEAYRTAEQNFDLAVAQNVAARLELAEANTTRQAALEHLSTITTEMEAVYGSLHGEQNLTLTQAAALLSEALADLNATSAALTEEEVSHNVTHLMLTGRAMSLRAELARYALLLTSERQAHLETQSQLSNTDESLDRANGTVTWLVVLLGLLAAMVVMLVLGLLLTVVYRKQNQGDMTGEIGIGVVVMGRPVAGQGNSPSAHEGHPLNVNAGGPATKTAWR